MLPILYSFRRCPYAIRARMAIRYGEIEVELREVILADKPAEMLIASPKGTVPVLILPDGMVLEESYDIIRWVLNINDPKNWLPSNDDLLNKTNEIINVNDHQFKNYLDQYKYATRFPKHSSDHYRNQAEFFLQSLEDLLSKSTYLNDDYITMADIAIFPFIRQFAFVDKAWFDQSPYTKLQKWLNNFLEMDLFLDVMKKYPRWNPDNEIVKF